MLHKNNNKFRDRNSIKSIKNKDFQKGLLPKVAIDPSFFIGISLTWGKPYHRIHWKEQGINTDFSTIHDITNWIELTKLVLV